MNQDQPTSAHTDSQSLSTATIISVCALVALVLAAIVILTLFNRPVDNVLAIIAAVIAPTLGTILAARKLDNAKSILHDVSVKVNGRLDSALNTISALEAQVVAAGGTPVTTPTIVAPHPIPPPPRHSAENPPAPVVTVTTQEVS